MITSAARPFWIIFALLSPLIPLQSYFAGNWYSVLHSYSLGMVFGAISYVYLLNALIITARMRHFDRLYGHNNVIIFHGYLALVALCCAIAHYVLKTQYFTEYTIQMIIGLVGMVIFLTIAAMSIMFMTKNPLHRIAALDRLRSAVTRTRIADYSVLKLFHNGTALASAVIAVHVLLSAATAENVWRMSITGAWAGAALLAYAWHKWGRVFMLRRRPLAVESVSRLASRIVEIRLKPVTGNLPSHKPGQFGYFRFISSACGLEEHPFTIASSSRKPYLLLVVKELGDYSGTLANLKTGDKTLYDGPYGAFTPREDACMHLLIAGGIGITPFMPMLDEWGCNGFKRRTHLLWSVRTHDDLIYRAQFEELDQLHERFSFTPVITREPTPGAAGRIDRALLHKTIHARTPARMQVFICGPEPMLDCIKRLLRALHIPRRNIHTERFSF